MTLLKPLLLAALLSSLLVGCHTVDGAGQDISAGGHAISTVATKTEAKM